MGYLLRKKSKVSSQDALVSTLPRTSKKGRKPKNATTSKNSKITKTTSTASFNTTISSKGELPPKRRGRKPTRSCASALASASIVSRESVFQTPRKRKANESPPISTDENCEHLSKKVCQHDESGLPTTPVARPWKTQVQSAKNNYHDGKRLPYSRNSTQTTLRRSARLSGRSSEFSLNLPSLTKLEQQIQARMNEFQNVDYRELKRRLAEAGKTQITPPNKGRPTYNLQKPESINRKFIDEQAEHLLDENTEPGQSEFQKRPGVAYLTRKIFDEDDYDC